VPYIKNNQKFLGLVLVLNALPTLSKPGFIFFQVSLIFASISSGGVHKFLAKLLQAYSM
jgi:hypothetical protein